MSEHHFTFSTCPRLLIDSWGEDARRATGMAPVEVIGKKYHKVIPRILVNDRDAVVSVLKSGRPVTIRGYYFSNITSHLKADVQITPRGREAAGAEVRISLKHSGERVGSEKLIDAGKNAIAFVHSVRNPLNAIKGAVIYLRKKYSQENILVEFASLIETEIGRLDDFISKFLSASSTEAPSTETSVNDLLKKVELLTSFQARLRKIRTSYSYGEAPTVVVNPFQVEQAVLNVVNNAIEALGPEDEISVRSGQRVFGEEEYTFIEISDTGPGMSQHGGRELASRLKNGKGFGLMITREIIMQNGGQFEITTGKGLGTLITILLPAKSAGTMERTLGAN